MGKSCTRCGGSSSVSVGNSWGFLLDGMKIHAGIIEVCVAKLLNFRVYTIVPNVHWGLGIHECDMLALDKEGRFTEIEIKCSLSDLKADFKKGHNHKSEIISRLIYAMPIDLCEKYELLVPSNCGIISVSENVVKHKWLPTHKAEWFRTCRHSVVKKPDTETIQNFMRLGCMRIWSLKEHNNVKRERQKLLKTA